MKFDGASKGNPSDFSIGGAIRNRKGEIISHFTSYIGHYNKDVAELGAILQGVLIT